MTAEQLWVGFGLLGQLLFTGRFLVQWLASERHGKSVIPISFWYLSLSGATVLMTYAIYRQDPVFIIGQSTGFLIYIRNLQLIRKPKSTSEQRPESETVITIKLPPSQEAAAPSSKSRAA